jgi:hypothetical protein
MTKEQYKQELGKREQQKNDNSVLEYSNSKIDYFLKKMIYHLDRIDNQIDDQNRARFTAICKQSMIALEEQSMIALESEIVDQNESVTRLLTV